MQNPHKHASSDISQIRRECLCWKRIAIVSIAVQVVVVACAALRPQAEILEVKGIVIRDDAGCARMTLGIDKENDASLRILAADGRTDRVRLGTHAAASAASLYLLREDWQREGSIVLSSNKIQGSSITTSSSQNSLRTYMGVDRSGAARLSLSPAEGNMRVFMSVDNKGNPVFKINDNDNKSLLNMP